MPLKSSHPLTQFLKTTRHINCKYFIANQKKLKISHNKSNFILFRSDDERDNRSVEDILKELVTETKYLNLLNEKAKRIDKMKFFGGLGKRSSNVAGSNALDTMSPIERFIAKKSKQSIDRMRFMGNIGK